MEFKGTKGKWTIKNGQICSSVYCGDEQIALRGRSTQEARADMVLISHAPEMLEMLQHINYFIEKDFNVSEIHIEIQKLIKSATEVDNV